MNTADWKLLLKYCPHSKKKIETNLLYTPLYTEDFLCMKFDHTHYYQNEMLYSFLKERPSYTKEFVKTFFDREVYYLKKFQDKNWSPTYTEIDIENQEITFKWSGETCNDIIFSGRNLNDYCENWEDQLFTIIEDIVSAGYYKLTLYPHCFYIEDGVLKTFDFYATIEKSFPYLKLNDIKGLVGERSKHRIDESLSENEYINMEIMFKRSLEQHIVWPNDALNKIYHRLF